MKPAPPLSVCILGRQPALGLAELESLYGADAVSAVSPVAAGLSLYPSEINFGRLGSSTRLGHVLAELPGTDWKTAERKLPDIVTALAATLPDGKIQLGLSAYGLSISPAKLNAAGLTLKKILRSRLGRAVRVTPNPELELNTAQVIHNRLTGYTGMELLLIAGETSIIVARTIAVQDIDSYTQRDRGRPKRDARVGMLPPKLAQTIINLAAGPMDPAARTLLDPFCGTGVTLQEAMLMGFAAYGTDLEQRMIDYADTNLKWLLDTFTVPAQTYRLEQGDATTHAWQQPIDLVAGETYLGRPFTGRPTDEVLAQTMSEVNLILKKFLQNIHGQLEPGTRLCLAVPAWQTVPGKFKFLPLVDQISDMGYNQVRFERVRPADLLYYREDQIVGRYLLIITRK